MTDGPINLDGHRSAAEQRETEMRRRSVNGQPPLAELEAAGDNARKLANLRARMAKIRVFDPACGSGNFLVIAYSNLIRKLFLDATICVDHAHGRALN